MKGRQFTIPLKSQSHRHNVLAEKGPRVVRPHSRSLRVLLCLCLFVLINWPVLPVWGLAAKPPVVHPLIGLSPLTSHTFDKPLFLTAPPDGTNRLFVVEQEGRIFVVTGGRTSSSAVLDISAKISTGGEKGLLGLAFHPKFSSNGRLFINYTRKEDGATVIAEHAWVPQQEAVDPQERILLVIPQPYSNHNGGMIAFGPDHYLYIGMGDGGSGGDPENRAQNIQELLGKFLRLDVDGSAPYAIPPDNPFIDGKGKAEIFALGVRNPWRFSFDRDSGELWAGDVGQNTWEEIDLIQKGKNYGWRLMEGRHCYNPKSDCQTIPGLVLPVAEYTHEQGRCSVTGGYVYRGSRLPQLVGTYIFGDFCSGEIWGFQNGQTSLLLNSDARISSFGEDQAGELYVVGHGGKIFHIVPPGP